MRSISIREFRARLAEIVDSGRAVALTRHGKTVAVIHPFREEDFAKTADPVVEAYKRDIDRTLIRENLRLTPEERLRNLESLQRFREGLRAPRRPRG
jgi:antitoxin (DNA-binding transcriptional repressor) of toxin-antitoxin stability system